MFKHLKLTLLPIILLPLTASALESIDIFTVEGLSMPIEPLYEAAKVSPDIHVMDELKKIEDALSEKLPSNEEEAAKMAAKLMQGQAFIDQADAARRGMDAVILAEQLNLEAIPAVVFDRTYIVYGEQPLKAYRIYQKFREAKQ